MAIAVSLLSSDIIGWDQVAAGPSQTFASSSITPGTNCLLVACLSVIGDNTAPFASTTLTGGTGLTWTSVVKGTAGAGFAGATAWWTAAVGGSDPGSFTVSGSYPNTNGSFSISELTIVAVTGHDTSTPTGGKVVSSGQAGNGAVSITLDAAPGSTDVTLAQCLADENTLNQGATFGTGTWTTLVSLSGASDKCAVNFGYRTGSTSTAVPWSDVNSGADNFSSTEGALVVKAAAAADFGASVLDPFTPAASGTVPLILITPTVVTPPPTAIISTY